MSKKITLIFFFITFNLVVNSQEKVRGNGILSIHKTPLNSFSKVKFYNDFEITLIKSSESAIEIATDENIHSHISFNITENVLVLKTDKRIKPKKDLKITIFFTNSLKEIEVNDDVEIETLSNIYLDELALTINDYAKAKINISSKRFTCINNNKSKIQINPKVTLDVKSSYFSLKSNSASNTSTLIKSDSLFIETNDRASLKIEGTSKYSKAIVNNFSHLKSKKLKSTKAFISTKGESEAIIYTTDSLTIDASEKSRIILYGNPQIEMNRFTNNARLIKKELGNK